MTKLREEVMPNSARDNPTPADDNVQPAPSEGRAKPRRTERGFSDYPLEEKRKPEDVKHGSS
jgi:hypothetical protein